MLELSECKVKVELTGILRRIAGKGTVTLSLKEKSTIKDLIFKLTELFSSEFKRALIDPELNSPMPNVLILLNGKEVRVLPKGLESEIKNGDKIVIIPVTHGG
ncbi:molybdopterin synthase sulfur carrier subunit [Candidatus Bathyarchaeota archaeon]|nr:MAG: molybdopterin synthase sulfur carrier subunit [Candidatus Bathyarchaeota archaeon]